jgi:hypothetical protein
MTKGRVDDRSTLWTKNGGGWNERRREGEERPVWMWCEEWSGQADSSQARQERVHRREYIQTRRGLLLLPAELCRWLTRPRARDCWQLSRFELLPILGAPVPHFKFRSPGTVDGIADSAGREKVEERCADDESPIFMLEALLRMRSSMLSSSLQVHHRCQGQQEQCPRVRGRTLLKICLGDQPRPDAKYLCYGAIMKRDLCPWGPPLKLDAGAASIEDSTAKLMTTRWTPHLNGMMPIRSQARSLGQTQPTVCSSLRLAHASLPLSKTRCICTAPSLPF